MFVQYITDSQFINEDKLYKTSVYNALMKKYVKNFQPNAAQRSYQASEAGVKLKIKRNIPQFMKKYSLTYAQIAEMFGYSTPQSFYNAHCRQDIMNGVEELIKLIEKKIED